MNVQDYISSGIVESYVLGLATPEEQAEFEQMAAQHPEVLQARIAFEIALEEQAMAAAVAPPAAWKDEIRNALPVAAPVRSIETPVLAPVRRMNGWKYAAAASIVLLAGSIAWNLSLQNNNRKLQDDYSGAVARLEQTRAKVDTMSGDLSVMTNPNMKLVSAKGLEASPQSSATIYWDTTTHDVYLVANNLPTPASNKQYQLWAIFNGKPVDLGVFDVKKERLVIQAKNAQGAEAFAITLEDRGGSPTPKGPMYVIGKL